MKKYRWTLRPINDSDTLLIPQLQAELNQLPEALARILVLRGIRSFEEARLFFRPSLEDLHDPFLMKDMDRAAERVAEAIERGERVLVYGDYDVDGTTATALMVSFLRDMGLNVSYFIPDRFKDGYGLGPAGIDKAASEDISLLIALDCGITGHDSVLYAREKGIDVIICDHHTVGETIPDALAVLDPKRPDCSYPFKELSGCGVGFKLAQAILDRLGHPAAGAFKYLDLVALSIASDIVPILGENRVLMHAGLRQLHEHPRIGIQKLAEIAGLDLHHCSTSQIVFSIGPRINAAGRLGDAKLAVDLLISTDEKEALDLAEQLENLNKQRRALDQQTLEQALEQAEQDFATCSKHALVLYHPDWHLGVIGIVASRLVEHFYRPTVMLCAMGDMAKGSARSIAGFNIYNALQNCQPLLSNFGGHDYAAGMTLPQENIPAFRERLNEVVSQTLSSELLIPEILIDAILPLNEITPRFWRILKQFAPFGPENRTPVFWAPAVEVAGTPAIVGSGHLKFRARHPGTSITFDVIGFGLHEYYPVVRESVQNRQPLSMLFSIRENQWQGRTSFQLHIKDIRLRDKA